MTPLSLRFIHLMLLFVIGLNGDNEFPKDEEVLVLQDENFEKAINTYRNVLVMFYAPWCRHSQAMMKDFAEAAKELANEFSSIKLAKIDGKKAPTLKSKYKIPGYPTLIFFNDGQVFSYTGHRNTESLISFVKSYSQ